MRRLIYSLARRVAFVGLAGSMAMPTMGSLVLELTTVVTGDAPSSATQPWLRATISQVSGTQVDIYMETVNLTGNENVKDWAFNLNPIIPVASLSAVEFARSGTFKPDPITLSTSVNTPGGFTFDFGFDFQTGGEVNDTFSQGDTVTMRLTRTDGLSVNDFYFTAPKNGKNGDPGPYLTAAHVQNTSGDDGSGTIGAVVVPEPSTYIAGALMVIPFLLGISRFSNKGRRNGTVGA